MDGSFGRKYKRVLEILPDVAECAGEKLILVGGTALALFHLKHRISVDLDFVPANGNDNSLKAELKGCMTKKGYLTIPGRFKNQFVVQFEDTSIKVEIFIPDVKARSAEEHEFGARKVLVASLADILRMKIAAYNDRQEARDLFDIFCILKSRGEDFGTVKKLLSAGMPKNLGDLEDMAMSKADAAGLRRVISDASS